MRATKSVSQPHRSEVSKGLLQSCLTLTYNAMEYGEDNHIDDRRGMKEYYRSLKGVDMPSCYKVAVITRACAVLKSREKGERRGRNARHRTSLRPRICITTGFFMTVTGKLFISLGHDRFEVVQLNRYAHKRISEAGVKVRSLTITKDSISLCYSKEVEPIPVKKGYGVDRNEKNLTFGDGQKVVQIGLSKIVLMKHTTREIVGSFKRDDVRLRKEISSKYWKRSDHRTGQMLHAATNYIVESAVKDRAVLALEELTGINRMYRRGNGQGADYRFRMNSWPHWKAWNMLQYKSAWKGVTVVQLTRSETRGSSTTHTCGERLRNPARDDVGHRRMLWCPRCKVWVDRDVNAAMVLSERGLARLASSLPRSRARKLLAGEKGSAGEAVMGNRTTPAILGVDACKLPSTEDATEPFTMSSSGSPGA